MNMSNFSTKSDYLAYLETLTLSGGSIAASAQAEILKYDPSQPRDDHGRWGTGGSSGSATDSSNGFSHDKVPDSVVGSKDKPFVVTVDGVPYKMDITVDKNISMHQFLEADGNGNLRISPERTSQYKQWVNNEVGKCTYVPPANERVYYMMGGGPASGKSSAINSGMLTDVPNVDPSKGEVEAVMANPDEAKKALGDPKITPEAADMGPKAAGYLHEESSIMSKMLDAQAKEEGKNILLDGTGDSSASKLGGKIDAAHDDGYQVKGCYAFCPIEDAIGRAAQRASGPEGRAVADSIITETTMSVSEVIGSPSNWDKALKKFDQVNLYETTDNNPRSEGYFDKSGNQQPSAGVKFSTSSGNLETPDGTTVFQQPVLTMSYKAGDAEPTIHSPDGWALFQGLKDYSKSDVSSKTAAAVPETQTGITWSAWVKAGRPNLFKVGDGGDKPLTVEQCNAIVIAILFGRSMKESGIPSNPRTDRLWEETAVDVKRLLDAGVSVDMVKEHPDPSPKK